MAIRSLFRPMGDRIAIYHPSLWFPCADRGI
jgi:hypothetical protein